MIKFQLDELEYILGQFHRFTGIWLGVDKAYLVETRLEQECSRRGCTGEEFLRLLREGNPGAQADLVCALTTQETFFYRDLGLFELLCEELLPELIRRRQNLRRLRIWSAGCATGQEPYSLAMLLHSHFPELKGWDLTILGTDISARALRRAEQARYTKQEVNRGLPVTKLLRYFAQQGNEWILDEQLRRPVQFRQESLLSPGDASCYDIIMCRNVLIYFDAPGKQRILSQLRKRLACDGYLFLGGPERILTATEDFVPVQRGSLVYFRPGPETWTPTSRAESL